MSRLRCHAPDFELFLKLKQGGVPLYKLFGSPKMPSRNEYQQKRAQDAEFRRLTDAVRRQVDWDLFLQKLSSGHPQVDLYGKELMPTLGEHHRRRAKNSSYRAAYFAALKRSPPRRKPQTTKAGDHYIRMFPIVLEKLQTSEMGPSEIFRSLGISHSEFLKAIQKEDGLYQRYRAAITFKGRPKFSDDEYDSALALYEQHLGKTYEFVDGELPGYNAMVRRSMRDAAFATEFVAARLRRLKILCELGIYHKPGPQAKKINSVKPKLASGQLQGQLRFDDLYSAAYGAVDQRGLPDHIRDDVISDLIEAVLDGSIRSDEIAASAGQFIRRHNKRAETFKFQSLDQTMADDNDTSFLDLLTTDSSAYSDYSG